jgi:hypothetical protein
MKIIVTEDQAKLLIEGKIKCPKCDHSWIREKNDEHPNLCHSCGWDNKSNKYNKTELKKFWKNHNMVNEIEDKSIEITEEYLKKRIPFLKYLKTSVTDERNGNVRIQFQDVTYNQNVGYVSYKTDPPTELNFRQYNTVLELYYYKDIMGGPRSENPRYRYAIGLRFEIPMAFEKGGDEMFEQIYRLANRQITEKLSYSNQEISENDEPSKEFMDESVNQILKRFFEVEDYIQNLPFEIKNPLAGYIEEIKKTNNNFIISENSLEKTKNMIDSSIEKIGLIPTIKKYGLTINVANKLIEPGNIFRDGDQLVYHRTHHFSVIQCKDIIEYYIFDKKELPSYYKDDEVEIYVDYDNFAGTWPFTIYFGENEREGITGYATIFWDDDYELPISIDFYRNSAEEYESEFEFNEFMVIDEKFKTIQQLVDYYKTNYFSAIKYYSKKALKIARKEMDEWLENN